MGHQALLVFLGLTLALGLAAAPALAQPGEGLGGFQGKLLEIKRSQLGPALGVDQRTVDKLLEIDQRYKPLKEQSIRKIRAELRHLHQAMNQPSPSEAEVNAILTNMRRKKREMLNLQERKDQEEMAILTPVQQARYLIYLMSLIREARSIKGGPGRAAPLGPGKAPREVPVSRPTE
jgi:Spy/CpxP family protein refolding chaperone